MPDNIPILDGSRAARTIRTTEVGGSHTPHNILATLEGSTPTPVSALSPLPVMVDGPGIFTRFGEALTAKRISQLNLKPTWGVSTLRYTTSFTGTGATAAETGGEFRIQSGTANNGVATIMTNQRGQYQAGAMGQAGVGVRIPTLPTATAFCEWGYTDFNNGFYFGVDGTGKYVAYVTGGSVTKAYQADWNVDKIDGTGLSGMTLDLADGVIAHIDFAWYGYGDIEFSYLLKDPTTLKMERVICHRFKIAGAASIIDPNQPLSFRSGNGDSTTTNLSLYVGGHQFSVVDGEMNPQSRLVSDLLTLYTTATNTDWQPIIAIRKKATLNGRENSVNVRLSGFQVAATGDLQIRVTVGGATSNLSWAAPTGRTATETAAEVKLTTTGVALTTSVDGEPAQYSYVVANGMGVSARGTAAGNADFVFGQAVELILWVRRISASGSIVINHANLTWTEEW